MKQREIDVAVGAVDPLLHHRRLAEAQKTAAGRGGIVGRSCHAEPFDPAHVNQEFVGGLDDDRRSQLRNPRQVVFGFHDDRAGNRQRVGFSKALKQLLVAERVDHLG